VSRSPRPAGVPLTSSCGFTNWEPPFFSRSATIESTPVALLFFRFSSPFSIFSRLGKSISTTSSLRSTYWSGHGLLLHSNFVQNVPSTSTKLGFIRSPFCRHLSASRKSINRIFFVSTIMQALSLTSKLVYQHFTKLNFHKHV
jgi:hypothetical protein